MVIVETCVLHCCVLPLCTSRVCMYLLSLQAVLGPIDAHIPRHESDCTSCRHRFFLQRYRSSLDCLQCDV